LRDASTSRQRGHNQGRSGAPQQVIWKLVNNAISSPKSGTGRIRARREGTQLSSRSGTTRSGIAERLPAHVSAFRTGTDREPPHGAMAGWALVSPGSHCRGDGGTVRAESGGSGRARVNRPICLMLSAARRMNRWPHASKHPSHAREGKVDFAQGLRVLVIVDEPTHGKWSLHPSDAKALKSRFRPLPTTPSSLEESIACLVSAIGMP